MHAEVYEVLSAVITLIFELGFCLYYVCRVRVNNFCCYPASSHDGQSSDSNLRGNERMQVEVV